MQSQLQAAVLRVYCQHEAHRLCRSQIMYNRPCMDCLCKACLLCLSSGLAAQIEDVVAATKAAQALVEEAHWEIQMSGIRPVLRLASLDAKIPLSLLRLPSDLSIPPEVPSSAADLEALTIDTEGLLNMAKPPVVKRAHRRVSWNSQQLAQVMSEAAKQKTPLPRALSSEAVAGSPEKDLERLSSGSSLPKDAAWSSSGTTGTLRRSVDRMISPFALTPAPSQS